MLKENEYRATSGLPALLILFVVLIIVAIGIANGVRQQNPVTAGAAAVVAVFTFICLGGFFTVNPGEAKALQLFGEYKGSVRQQGFWWANPFLTKKGISLRIRNFETTKLKVNDNHGNPIEIAAIVVWKVVDTAEALFEVDNYSAYVEVQSESAVRTVAQSYPYDSHEPGEEALSTHTAEVSHALQQAIQDRLARAGVEVVEARISHLAYAQEIAQAMLRRQQANAVVAARSRIVEGAVGMVELALNRLTENGVVTLDEERTAAMVSNLMVVLCGDQPPSPVVNTGSLYT